MWNKQILQHHQFTKVKKSQKANNQLEPCS